MQDRYIALKEGTLVYFKSEIETDFGCRGAISIDKATVTQHEVDDLRFDVSGMLMNNTPLFFNFPFYFFVKNVRFCLSKPK